MLRGLVALKVFWSILGKTKEIQISLGLWAMAALELLVYTWQEKATSANERSTLDWVSTLYRVIIRYIYERDKQTKEGYI